MHQTHLKKGVVDGGDSSGRSGGDALHEMCVDKRRRTVAVFQWFGEPSIAVTFLEHHPMTSGVLTLLAFTTSVGGYCACAPAAAPSTAPGAHDIPAGGVVVPLFPDLPATQPDGGE